MRQAYAHPGLLYALENCDIPAGTAVDLGCGPAPCYSLHVSPRFPLTAYDADWTIREDVEAFMREHGLDFQVETKNVLELELPSESQAIVLVGMIVYNPKYIVRDFLPKTVTWLRAGGIWHGEFATYKDASVQSEFVQMGSAEDEEGSYIHSCGDPACYQFGKLGGSFWDLKEAEELVQSSGPLTIVHTELFEWVEDCDPEGRQLFRSFYQITAQKIS